MKLWFYIIFVLIFISGGIASASPDLSALQNHVKLLSSDQLQGRLTGTEGERRATQYVAGVFQQLGFEAAGDNGTYFQKFNFTAAVAPGKNKKGYAHNVLARLRLNPNATQVLVIGAHLDHLGHGDLGNSRARNNETGMIHPGADDNASGVACMLEVAARLSQLKAAGKLHGDKDILFAAWSGEELGILGSSHFVKNYKNKIDAAINLDMVGHLKKFLVLQGTGSSSDWPSLIKKISVAQPVAIIQQKDPYLPTDSTSFYLHGVPDINFFTGANDDYHTPRDKAETLNYTGIINISDLLLKLILALENNKPITYHAVAQRHENAERDLKIYLGTIPDYASADVSGVKLSGVAKNSPAERAGLKTNDVIIKLDGKNIHNIYDYSYALNSLRIGTPTQILITRGKSKLSLNIVPRYRD